MKPSSKLRRVWCQLKMDPTIGPVVTGWAVFALTMPLIGAGWFYVALLLWAVLWAVLEHVAARGYPKSHARLLTPYFYAVKDLSGYWRVFQRRREESKESCKLLLKDLLEDQYRLPAALEPGKYHTLTHGTILARLERMDNVVILSSSPAYVATLEKIINQATGKRCRHCTKRCPFHGRQKPRQFYDVRFLVKEGGPDEGGRTGSLR